MPRCDIQADMADGDGADGVQAVMVWAFRILPQDTQPVSVNSLAVKVNIKWIMPRPIR
jgi:hypothetical protein